MPVSSGNGVQDLQLLVSMNVADFMKQMKQADEAVLSFSKSATTAILGIGGTGLGLGAEITKGLADSLKGITDHLNVDLGKSDSFDLPLAQLQALRFAANNAGLSSEKLDQGLNHMIRNISRAGTSATDSGTAIKTMGLNIKDVQAAGPIQQLLMIQQAYQKLSVAQQGLVRYRLFEETGIEMGAFMTSDIAKSMQLFQQIGGGVSKSQEEIIANFRTTQLVASAMWEQFTQQVAIGVLPALTNIIKYIEQVIAKSGGIRGFASDVAGYFVTMGKVILQVIAKILDGLATVASKFEQIQGSASLGQAANRSFNPFADTHGSTTTQLQGFFNPLIQAFKMVSGGQVDRSADFDPNNFKQNVVSNGFTTAATALKKTALELNGIAEAMHKNKDDIVATNKNTNAVIAKGSAAFSLPIQVAGDALTQLSKHIKASYTQIAEFTKANFGSDLTKVINDRTKPNEDIPGWLGDTMNDIFKQIDSSLSATGKVDGNIMTQIAAAELDAQAARGSPGDNIAVKNAFLDLKKYAADKSLTKEQRVVVDIHLDTKLLKATVLNSPDFEAKTFTKARQLLSQEAATNDGT